MARVFVTVCCFVAFGALVLGGTVGEEKKPKATIAVQATNNTQVPSVTYIVSAVECLEEAYSIYDNDEDRATLYAALFEEKHNGSWNVIVGYTAVFVHSDIYVETMVTGEKSKKSDDANKLFFIYSD
ncbi:uncharacterized protein LOC103314373 [Tribolium castaneum]|uniref:Uncharacterized protein n=1 Tax=Tribolium castaneum TaxID=7070 RepID=D6X1B1_TRICA|nr:PREDICTED: uncharacterized protein LOC103314373 [Tribolium castaneum]EFA10603.1 hypothetical protein TcasGA2_TC012864 [Tribolium castaneum]|eukprot:XP_008198509.1 PREDICTED: uncharacterized protein LOC103314373 [Tribolium castaneum]